jgi:hypothetical protein
VLFVAEGSAQDALQAEAAARCAGALADRFAQQARLAVGFHHGRRDDPVAAQGLEVAVDAASGRAEFGIGYLVRPSVDAAGDGNRVNGTWT